MRKRMRIHGTDMGIKCGTVMDKMRHFNEFFSPLIYVVVLIILLYNVVVLIIHNVSYTAISIKVATETIVKCTIWPLKG